MADWKENLEPLIRNHMEKQISETLKYREAYSRAKKPGNAQLWCAIAELSREIFNANLKLAYMERLLRDLNIKKIEKKIVVKKPVKKKVAKKSVKKRVSKRKVIKKKTKKVSSTVKALKKL